MKLSTLSMAALVLLAQGAPRVGLQTFLETKAAHAGAEVRAALEVTLPRGYHVNSNEPHDEFLVPTELVLDLPDGVRLVETVYPEPIELETSFSSEPLAVYENQFLVGFALELGKELPEGELTATAKLRYQACDDRACYRPETKEKNLELVLVSNDRALSSQHQELFASIPFAKAR